MSSEPLYMPRHDVQTKVVTETLDATKNMSETVPAGRAAPRTARLGDGECWRATMAAAAERRRP